jgi:hypothetical protein
MAENFCWASIDAIKFQTADAYSSSSRTTAACKIQRLSVLEKDDVIYQPKHNIFNSAENIYCQWIDENIVYSPKNSKTFNTFEM